ncbi:MAG: UDP-N-acetylmuramate--L-alanine ligase [Bacteroidales bacterium]|jgi:UDP-N-acetylmuramate: L-alanyl-gamma-D-glutamyl-meso-diaminopimelate ligase
MRYHFISIGGSIMHSLAIAMHLKGAIVTGSDDEIFEPAKSNLAKYNLLPSNIGWDASKITDDIDIIILGMHAKADNPELLKAQELGLKILSFPEFIYENSKNKIRIVIGGSHGKTTITSMILHVLKELNIKADYLVGAKIPNYDVMVNITDDAKYLIVEGDEYLTSTLDKRPKFHLYHPYIALLTGIAWDHFNVFPTFDFYVEQFKIFVDKIEKGGSFIYFDEDENLRKIAKNSRSDIQKIPYNTPNYTIKDNNFIIIDNNIDYKMEVIGKHNMQNLLGAMNVCNLIGITNESFLKAMQSFKGAAKRMELIKKTEELVIYRDFAHAPSKVKATINAIKEQYPTKKLIAVLELHTYSSLNIDFLPLYKGTLNNADKKLIFFDFNALKLKKLPLLNKDDVKKAFDDDTVEVFNDIDKLKEAILNELNNNAVLLLMSSGDFGGMLNNLTL